MAALTAVVVALSIAVAANFLLLLAVVRRLRMQQPPPPPMFDMPKVGVRVPAFGAVDVEGETVDDGFCVENSEVVIAFFADNCEPCERLKAQLLRNPLEDPLLAFVQVSAGSGTQHQTFVSALAGLGARTVLIDRDSDIRERFAISAFPTLLRVQNAVVVASGVRLTDVRRQSSGPLRTATKSHAGAPRSDEPERRGSLIRN
jgi:thiol-disulfide isomerase/thioredoxin